MKEFGSEGNEDNNDLENVCDADISKPQKTSKPSDYQMIFGGNNEDSFVIGIKFTR